MHVWDSGLCLNPMPFHGVVFLGSWLALWTGQQGSQSCHEWLFFVILVTQAISWLCQYYRLYLICSDVFGLLHACVSWLGCAVLCSHDVGCSALVHIQRMAPWHGILLWSGVDLGQYLHFFKNPSGAFKPPDTPPNLAWIPMQTYAWAELLETKIGGIRAKV